MKVTYQLPEEARKNSFVKTGKVEDRVQSFDMDVSALSQETREVLMGMYPEVWNNPYISIGASGCEVTFPEIIENPNEDTLLNALAQIKLARIDKAEERKLEVDLMRTRLEAQPDGTSCYNDYWYNSVERNFPELKAEIKAAQKLEAEAKAERDAKKQALKDEMELWIIVNGSERLKLALANGYECSRLYREERAPEGYHLFEDEADFDEVWNPSLEALKEAEAVGGRVKIKDDREVVIFYPDWLSKGLFKKM